MIAATLEKIALEIRHLQRTEVREAEEPFGGEQRGSSAMPHKRNPVSCEQICGLARVVRANSQAAFENIALWHERDISHSSVERVILPDSTILADYMLARMTEIVADMRVFPERMRRNLDATQGLVFSGQLLQDLVEQARRAKTRTNGCRNTPWRRGNRKQIFASASRATATSRNFLTPRPWHTLSIWRVSFARWMQFSGAFLGPSLPRRAEDTGALPPLPRALRLTN